LFIAYNHPIQLSIPIFARHFNMKGKPDLSASLEDYIEAIYHIIGAKLVARSKEIAARLSVSRASVTEALRALSKKGLINYSPYEAITLTEEGKTVAEDVIFRHQALKQFFIKVLSIDDSVAEEGACRIEHAAPPEIIARMISFTEFMQVCPRGGDEMIKGFADYCTRGKQSANCNTCVSHCREVPGSLGAGSPSQDSAGKSGK
jgi:DtxR family transcriptional regulator, Mn-dependent transcriptional regulator